MADGFLSRWSRRKLDAKEGEVAARPAFAPASPNAPAAAGPLAAPAGGLGASPAADVARGAEAPAVLQGPADPLAPGAGAEASADLESASASPAAGQAPPAPTLEDVARLGSESDFSRFVAPDVSTDVKNAALKKLFADPRFNVMDGMDVYIDDYSQPDPIPESMLRKLVASQFLKLFEEVPKEAETQSPATPVANDFTVSKGAEFVAQSAPSREDASAYPSHADPDLRLQQDDAPPGEDPGPGHR